MTDTATEERRATKQEPAWKRRFRAPRLMFPSWARDDADHLLFLSNAGGKFEVHTWDRRTGEQRRLTDRSEGTGYRVPARLEPSGQRVWWFDDQKGNELGRWVRQSFGGDEVEQLTPGLEPSYSAGLALGRDFAVIGRSRGDEGTTVYVRRDGAAPKRIYAHAPCACSTWRARPSASAGMVRAADSSRAAGRRSRVTSVSSSSTSEPVSSVR